MKTISLGATEARNNKEFVRLVSEKKPDNSFVSLKEVITKSFGIAAANLWPYEKSKIIKSEKQDYTISFSPKFALFFLTW